VGTLTMAEGLSIRHRRRRRVWHQNTLIVEKFMRKYKYHLQIIICLLLNSCNSEIKSISKEEVSNPKIKFHFSLDTEDGYVHYLLIKNYNQKHFKEYNFVTLAYKYLDKVKTDTPVVAIIFVFSDNDWNSLLNIRSWDAVEKNSVVGFYFGVYQKNIKKPDIKFITYWKNGKKDIVRLQ
jgi:hypothetical protein